ncbi:CBS domain-containing protein [Kaarinaea lacus]
MSVGEFCNRDVVIANRKTTLTEIAQLMREHHVGCVVVVENKDSNNIPIGIITDRDLVVELIAENIQLDSVTAGDVMSANLLLGREIDGLWETIKRMRSKGVRRVPVVNDEKVLVGILTVDDVLEILASELTELVSLISREQYKEDATRSIP